MVIVEVGQAIIDWVAGNTSGDDLPGHLIRAALDELGRAAPFWRVQSGCPIAQRLGTKESFTGRRRFSDGDGDGAAG